MNKLKRIGLAALAASLLLLSMPSHATRAEFCAGFEAGYKTGYKQAHSSSLNPLTPVCPLQPLKGFGDPSSDYEHGYTVGYSRGRSS